MDELNISTALGSLLECSLCMKTIEKPMSLPCLHFYCQKCIDGLSLTSLGTQEGIRCPICCEFTLKTNTRHSYFVQSILELLDKSTKANHCGDCYSNDVMVRPNCNQVFFQQSTEIHKNYELLKHHTLMPTDGNKCRVDEPFCCELHHLRVELYCRNCETFVCHVCKATKHKAHQLQTVSDALQGILPDARKNLQTIENVLYTDIDILQCFKSKQQSLLQHYKELEALVEVRRFEAIRKINDAAAGVRNKITIISEKHAEDIQDCSSDITYKGNLISETPEIIAKKSGIGLLATPSEEMTKSLQTPKTQTPAIIAKKSSINLLATPSTKMTEALQPAQTQTPEIVAKNSGISLPDTPSIKMAKALQTAKQTKNKDKAWDSSFAVTEISTSFSHIVSFRESAIEYLTPNEFLKPQWMREKLVYHGMPFAFSVHIFNNKLWIGDTSKNKVLVLTLRGKFWRSVTLPGSEGCLSVKSAWNGLVICKKDGIYALDKNGAHPRIISDSSYCDSSFHRGYMYALDSMKPIIHCFTNSHHGWYNITRTIKLNGCGANELNTIQVTDKGIFIGQISGHVITQHDDTGTLTAIHGGHGQLWRPRLCGADRHLQLLIANRGYDKLQILNPATGNLDTIYFKDVLFSPVCASIYGNTCFILDHSGLSIYKLVHKYFIS